MNLPSLLEVIQVQRHDFLNHLQVISGLLQLNKTDRVKEYIDYIKNEMKNLSVINEITIPELKAILLIALNEASKKQINFDCVIETKLAGYEAAGKLLSDTVEYCLNSAMQFLSPREVMDRRLILNLTEDERGIYVKVTCPGLLEEQLTDLYNIIANTFTGQPIEVNWYNVEQRTISFTLPRYI